MLETGMLSAVQTPSGGVTQVQIMMNHVNAASDMLESNQQTMKHQKQASVTQAFAYNPTSAQQKEKKVTYNEELKMEEIKLEELSEIQCKTPPDICEGDSVLIITASNTQIDNPPKLDKIQNLTQMPSATLPQPGPNTTKSTNSNTTWTKVTFAKRKSSTSLISQPIKNTDTSQTTKPSLTSKILNKQQSLPLKDSSRKRNPFADGGPLPVFDCLFCCQEHFVLDKMNELSLVNKYANHKPSYEGQRDRLMMEMIVQRNMNPGQIIEEIIDANPLVIAYQIGIDYGSELKKQLISVQKQQLQQPSPQVPKLQIYLLKIRKFQSTAHQLPLQKSLLPIAHPASNKNFLGLEDEDPEESILIGGNGVLHFRTRRQRILQTLSFETDYHNIFDPCYTSDEERDSVDLLEDCSESEGSEECYDSEEDNDASEEEEEEDLHSVSVDEDEELKEIVNEYQRSEERKKRNRVESLSPSPIKQAAEDTRGNQSISSIEQETDEDGFSASDNEEEEAEEAQQETLEEENTPVNDLTLDKGGCITNPLSFINATTSNHAMTCNNLNIQENTIEKAEDDDDDDSERYTFGCVTPKADGEITSLQNALRQGRVNFSQAENSLSPVRAETQTALDRPLQYESRQSMRFSNPRHEYGNEIAQNNKRSPSLNNNPMMLDISPVSCNAKQISYIGDGTKNGLVHSINEGEGFSLRGAKIDFYPAQELDSIEDMQLTGGPALLAQKSYEEGTSDFTANQQHLLMLSKTEELEFTTTGVAAVAAAATKRLSHFSQSYQSDANNVNHQTNDDQEYDTTQQVMTQYYNNQPPDAHPQQAHSFTTTYKYKHQRLIPSQSQAHTITDTTPEQNRHTSNVTIDSHKSLKTQFLFKQDQFQEILRKAKQSKNGKNTINPQHLASFDSMPNTKHIAGIYDTEGKANYKQKTQALCTPLDTNDQINMPYTQVNKGQMSKTNKTTINQNIRRQGGSSNAQGLYLGSCKNGTSSQSNLLNGPHSDLSHGVPQNIFTGRKLNDFDSTKTFQSTNKQPKNNQKLSDTIVPLLLAYDNLGVKAVQVSTTKASHVKQSTQSPSIMKMTDQKNLKTLNVDLLTQKEINQFLKSALISSRYSSTAGFNNLCKGQQQQEKAQSLINPSSHQESVSKNNTKKKKKTTKPSKNQTLTSVGAENTKKIAKSKKTKKNIANKQGQQNFNDHSSNKLGLQQQSQQDLQAYINICNSMNFSNDYSIPSIISGGVSQVNPITQKSTSMNSGHPNNKSSQNALMYLSMQEGKTLFSAGNNTNIQDTSNNYPYGGSIQAEMSTCISQGQHTLSTTRGGIHVGKGSTNKTHQTIQPQHHHPHHPHHPSVHQQLHPEKQKLNGSLEEMNLFSLLSALGSKKTVKGSKDNERQQQNASVMKQASQAVHQRSVERAGSQTMHHPDTDQKSSHHPGQFSFSQRDFTLNQTTDLQKTQGFHGKRKSKGGQQASQTFSNINLNMNVPSMTHASTVKNTTIQKQRRDNNRTRSNSKSSHIIKTDHPTHQLLLQNQINFPLQIKNKQTLLGLQVNQQQQSTAQKEMSKTNNIGLMKNKKQVQEDRGKNQSRTSNKSSNQADKISHQMITTANGMPYAQDLNRLYGTGKIMMSNVTSPLRPLASNFTSGAVGHSINFGPYERAALSLIKNDLFQTQIKEDRRQQQ